MSHWPPAPKTRPKAAAFLADLAARLDLGCIDDLHDDLPAFAIR